MGPFNSFSEKVRLPLFLAPNIGSEKDFNTLLAMVAAIKHQQNLEFQKFLAMHPIWLVEPEASGESDSQVWLENPYTVGKRSLIITTEQWTSVEEFREWVEAQETIEQKLEAFALRLKATDTNEDARQVIRELFEEFDAMANQHTRSKGQGYRSYRKTYANMPNPSFTVFNEMAKTDVEHVWEAYRQELVDNPRMRPNVVKDHPTLNDQLDVISLCQSLQSLPSEAPWQNNNFDIYDSNGTKLEQLPGLQQRQGQTYTIKKKGTDQVWSNIVYQNDDNQPTVRMVSLNEQSELSKTQKTTYNLTKETAEQLEFLEGTISENELNSKFRRLAIQHHPDKGGNAEEFKAINNAYESAKRGPKQISESVQLQEMPLEAISEILEKSQSQARTHLESLLNEQRKANDLKPRSFDSAPAAEVAQEAAKQAQEDPEVTQKATMQPPGPLLTMSVPDSERYDVPRVAVTPAPPRPSQMPAISEETDGMTARAEQELNRKEKEAERVTRQEMATKSNNDSASTASSTPSPSPTMNRSTGGAGGD